MNEKRAPAGLRFAVVAVDAVCFRIVDGKLCVLVGKVANPLYRDRWGLIGGLVLEEESAEEAVTRHLREKAGCTGIYTEQLATFSRIDRDPRNRVVSIAYLGLVAPDASMGKGSVETEWRPVARATHLAYDHDEILAAALARLKSKFGYSTIARHLVPPRFTLTELQRLYEEVLRRPVDKRNFRKRLISLTIVRGTGTKRRAGTHRPAELFSFVGKGVRVLDFS